MGLPLQFSFLSFLQLERSILSKSLSVQENSSKFFKEVKSRFFHFEWSMLIILRLGANDTSNPFTSGIVVQVSSSKLMHVSSFTVSEFLPFVSLITFKFRQPRKFSPVLTTLSTSLRFKSSVFSELWLPRKSNSEK